MQPKTKALLAAAAGVIALGVAGTTTFAATTTSVTPLVDRLAAAFNLDKTKVQEVVDQYKTEVRTERQAERTTDLTERLDQAVTDGKLSTAQRDAIIAKQKELDTKRDAAMALTDKDARHDAMDAIKDEYKAWATENNIPTLGRGMLGEPGGRGGSGGPGGHGRGGDMIENL